MEGIPLILEAVEQNGQRHRLWSQADLDLNHGSAAVTVDESLRVSEP